MQTAFKEIQEIYLPIAIKTFENYFIYLFFHICLCLFICIFGDTCAMCLFVWGIHPLPGVVPGPCCQTQLAEMPLPVPIAPVSKYFKLKAFTGPLLPHVLFH